MVRRYSGEPGGSRRPTSVHTVRMATGAKSAKQTHPVGVDFGGSGIKAALVDIDVGAFAGDRVRVETPAPATPDRVAAVVGDLLGTLEEDSRAPVGITVPAVVKHGIASSAANIDASWVGVDAD
ncbi:MAG: polyphosphate glucokinase, partial [Nocardioidaceae bacterium]|nr:polyphosphate glucokinase [Nocardioidaceae bacterium]